MDSKFKTNGVLVGAVDYFCLVCESHLYNEIDAVTHINKPVHTKNFNLTNYFENKEDCIRKIKKWYFCELCNLLLSTSTKVRLHVTEVQHIEYKNERLLERNGNFVVAFSNLQIHDKTWNGIIEDTCVICNTEFENEKIHINKSAHIIKLIQSKIEFDANKNVYRKTDDSSIQCLTCNMVLTLSSLDAHFNLPEHIKLYQEAFSSVRDISLQNETKANEPEANTVNKKQDKELEEEVSPVTESNINRKKIENVDGECAKENAKVIKKCDKDICEILNAKNYIIKDDQLNGLMCILCYWEVDPVDVKRHTSGIHHQTMLKLHKNRISKLNANQITSFVANDKIGQAINTDKKNYEDGHTILDSIENFQKNNIRINFEIQTAFCIKCSTSLNFNKVFIENHIKEHTKNLDENVLTYEDDNKNKKNCDNDGSILDCLENFQKNNIQINFETQTAHCKKCSISLDFNKVFIENHIYDHNKTFTPEKKKTQTTQGTCEIGNRKTKNTPTKKSSIFTIPAKKKSKDKQTALYTEEDIKKIAEENDMTYTPNNKEVHCNKCNTEIPCFPTNIHEHIAGNTHKAKASIQDLSIHEHKSIPNETINKVNLNKIAFSSFVISMVSIDSALSRDTVLNKRICINTFSFVFLVNLGTTFVCPICKTHEPQDQLDKHLNSSKHKKFFDDSLIVVEGDEFIREIQPDVYHCGYCNMVQPSWDIMQKHLQCDAHRDNKTCAEWRLQQYLPQIESTNFDTREHFELNQVFDTINENENMRI